MFKNLTPQIQNMALDGLTDDMSGESRELCEVSERNGVDGDAHEAIEAESADKIKKFMRKFLAAQCVGNMFSTGCYRC